MGEDVGGIAVHIGARVASLAGAGEVLVSRTVKDWWRAPGCVSRIGGARHSRECLAMADIRRGAVKAIQAALHGQPQALRKGSDHIVRRQGSPDPLNSNSPTGSTVRVLDLRQHPRTDEDLARLGLVAQPRGDV